MKTKFELTQTNYRYLFNNASDAMWVHDMDGEILIANKACEKLSGYNIRELVGLNVTRFLPLECLDKAREIKHKLLKGPNPEHFYELSLLKKDGSTRMVRMATSLVIIDNEPRGFQNIASDVTEENQMRENMCYYVQQITRAQEDERKRIARELHDDLAPLLLLLLQRLDSITSHPKHKLSEALKDELGSLHAHAIQALEGLRSCAQNLRPRILDDLGLIAAMEWMTENLSKTCGILSRVEITGTERSLPAEVQLLLFRIAQEALSNIRKHSHASSATVKFEFNGNKVKMTISDDGQGFEPPSKVESLASNGKLGIIGMYERARLLNGSLKIQSEPKKGTTIIAEIPIKD